MNLVISFPPAIYETCIGSKIFQSTVLSVTFICLIRLRSISFSLSCAFSLWLTKSLIFCMLSNLIFSCKPILHIFDYLLDYFITDLLLFFIGNISNMLYHIYLFIHSLSCLCVYVCDVGFPSE